MTNAGRQLPNDEYSQMTIRGAIEPPTADPLSKIATASPRSDFGNHSETAFVAPGQFPPSPAPNMNRKSAKLRSPTAVAVAIATSEYHSTANESPFRVPSLSNNRPETNWKIVYPHRNAITISAKSEFDQWNSTFRYGAR